MRLCDGRPPLQAPERPAQEDGALQALSRLSLLEGEVQVQQYAQRKAEQAARYDELLWRVEAAGQDPRLELLARSLRQAGRQQATRAFLALGLLQGFASTSLAVENLGSRDPAQLANALESLESLRPRALVGPLIGLWDSAGRISAAGETSSDSLPESLRMLLAGGDPWLRARAALAAGGPDGPPRVG